RYRSMIRQCITRLVFVLLPLSAARGDVVIYQLPTTSGQTVILEGTTTVNAGGTVTFQHARFGKVYFDLESVEIKKAPSITTQFNRLLGRAGNDAEKRLEAAQWALRHGLLNQFYAAIDKVLEANPRHPRAALVKQLKAKMNAEFPESAEQEAELKALVGRDDMKVTLSKHFILLHDTPPTLTRGKF